MSEEIEGVEGRHHRRDVVGLNEKKGELFLVEGHVGKQGLRSTVVSSSPVVYHENQDEWEEGGHD